MEFEDKLARGMALLESKGLKRQGLPLSRLLWRIGIAVPPPLFAGFWLNTIVHGVPFGIMFGALTVTFYSDRTLAGLVLQAAITAILYGLAMAFWTRHVAAKHGLPRWDDLEPKDDRSPADRPLPRALPVRIPPWTPLPWRR